MNDQIREAAMRHEEETALASRPAILKCVLTILVGLALSAAAADWNQDDLATKVIQSNFSVGYNPLNNSEQELNNAAIANSELRLQHLILHEASDEMRICFALRILKEQIATARRAVSVAGTNDAPAQAHLATLLDRQIQLAREFREIQARKAKANETKNTTPAANPRNIKTEERP